LSARGRILILRRKREPLAGFFLGNAGAATSKEVTAYEKILFGRWKDVPLGSSDVENSGFKREGDC